MDWHRLFGLILTDYLAGTPYVVELEKDLSRMQQYLDVVIVRKTAGAVPFRMPDGLDNLVDHNLISFKSHHEAFSADISRRVFRCRTRWRIFAGNSRKKRSKS